jgi:YqaJ-like viral recombinase domain
MTALELMNIEQGSELWAEARCGLVTASRCGDVIATTKKAEAAARRDYRSELIAEILTGVPYPRFVSQAMQWGIDQEPFARAAYEMQRDLLVETCGFVLHPDMARFGASPDGLVGDDGLIQIKCPNTTTHLGWMLGGTVPVEHAPQMLAEMACTGRAWCDFVSFDPRLPPHLQLFVRRFERNDSLIAQLETEVIHFNAEIEGVLSSLPQKPQGVVLSMDQVDVDEIQF